MGVHSECIDILSRLLLLWYIILEFSWSTGILPLIVQIILQNWRPTPLLDYRSPFEALFGEKPNYTNIKIFRCLCFPWLRPYSKNKLECGSTRVLLWYSKVQKGFRCLYFLTLNVYISCHVYFDEMVFYFVGSIWQTTGPKALKSVTPSTLLLPPAFISLPAT